MIKELLEKGLTYSEISEKTGKTKATISYHAKKLGIPRQIQKTYDWSKVQKDIDNGFSIGKLKKKYGMVYDSIIKAVNRGDITKPKTKLDASDYLVENCTIKRHHVKKYIIDNNLIEYKCHSCNHTGDWNGQKLVLQLEHKNGINNDNRLENLEFLCPNCHSQTDTFAGKNANNSSVV